MVDWWAMGVIIFECYARRRPFVSPSKDGMLQSILKEEPPFELMGEEEDGSTMHVEITRALLHKSTKKRLGRGGANEVRQHAYFSDLDWDLVLRMKPAVEANIDLPGCALNTDINCKEFFKSEE